MLCEGAEEKERFESGGDSDLILVLGFLNCPSLEIGSLVFNDGSEVFWPNGSSHRNEGELSCLPTGWL